MTQVSAGLADRIAKLSPKQRALLEQLRHRKREAPLPPPISEPFGLIAAEDRAKLPEGIVDAYPLGAVQLGMLFQMQRQVTGPSPPVYHNVNSAKLKFRHRFRPDALQEAVDAVIARHPVLRTSFDLDGYREPLQLVHGKVRHPVRIEDLRGLPPERQREVVDRFILDENFRLMGTDKPPLMRLHIHWLADDTIVMSHTEPHSISDGWSTNLTLFEIYENYMARAKGDAPPERLPLQVTYRDFIKLERDAIASTETRAFWSRILEECTPTRLPVLPKSFHPEAGIADHRHQFVLSTEAVQRLFALAESCRVPIKVTLLAAHLRVLALLSGQRRVTTGLVFNGRPEVPGGEQLRGLFLNTLPFPVHLHGGTWLDLIRQVHQAEAAMIPHRRYPLAALQAEKGREHLFHAAFSFHHFHSVNQIGYTGEAENEIVSDLTRTDFDLMVTFNLDPIDRNILMIIFDGNLEQVAKHQFEEFFGYYRRVLEAMGANPKARYDSHHFLGEVLARRVLADWNRTDSDYPRQGIAEVFEREAARAPEAIAASGAGVQVSYGELAKRAGRMAGVLRGRGVDRETPVALSMERSLDAVIAMLAILQAGGFYVPLDPAQPVARLRLILADADPVLLVTRSGKADAFEGPNPPLVFADRLPAARTAVPRPANLPSQSAYVMYTSGSTGVPKGVSVPHRAVMRLVRNTNFLDFSKHLTFLQLAPLSFDASTLETWGPLLNRGKLVIFPEQPLDLARLGAAILEQGIDTLWLTAELFHQMVDHQANALRRVRRLLAGGDVLDAKRVNAALTDSRIAAPDRVIVNGYGPTENTTFTCCHGMRAGYRVTDSVPIGRPIANTRVFLLDGMFQPLPPGVPGWLYMAGDGLARGYLNQPGLTAERFVPHPFASRPGSRLYQSGDRVTAMPDGEMRFMGRGDNQIKLRGYRIELDEIAAVLGGHPEVDRAVVVLHRDNTGTDSPGLGSLAAYVTGKSAGLKVEDLRVFAQNRLPAYMVPEHWSVLPEMPLNPNGKIDRTALPAPGSETPARKEPVGDLTPTESLVAEIWADLLQRPRIGPDDNFFDLGGHSLLATRMISRLRTSFNIDFGIRAFFESANLRDLATRVDETRQRGLGLSVPPIEPVPRDAPLPLSFSQQRLWFLDRLEPGSHVYNIPLALRFEGPLDIGAVARSYREIVRRHEVLRTSFAERDGEPVQVVAPEAVAPVGLVDLRALSEDRRAESAAALSTAESRRPFDLANGPLMRVTVARLTESDHLLLAVMHHIASDGWSLGVLMREIGTLYGAFQKGQASPLPPLPVQYADFAVWQRQWLHGENLEKQLAYWRSQLADAPASLDLPTDYPRPQFQSFNGNALAVRLTPNLTRELHRLCRRESATLFMTLLAAFQIQLSRYAGQSDICVGSPIANRNRNSTEGLIGFFVNTLVLRTRLPRGCSFSELLARVRETALDAYAHQDLPFEKLVDELRIPRNLDRTPLFQAFFALQNAGLPQAGPVQGELRTSAWPLPQNTAKFELSLFLTESGGMILGNIDYNTDLFAQTGIRRMAGHFETLLLGIAANPDAPIESLPLLRETERSQILDQWNDTVAGPGPETSLHGIVDAQAAATPDRTALVFESRHRSYGALTGEAAAIAAGLRARGIGAETPVGICMERSPEMVTGMLGILWAGAHYVPLDPEYPTDRLAAMAGDAQPAAVLSQPHLAARLDALETEVWCTGDTAIEPKVPPASPISSPNQAAYMIYTSGSTGKPKGVVNAHGAIVNRLRWGQHAYPLTGADRVLQKTPFSFDVSVWECFWPPATGACLVVARPDGHRDRDYLDRLISTRRIGVTHFVPSMLELFIEDRQPGATSLRLVICSGEALAARLRDRFYRCFQGPLLLNLYGPTEAAVEVSYHACPPGETGVPIGRPIANIRLYPLDTRGNPSPVGVPGELHIGGAGLARGYRGRPRLTAEKFLPDPFAGEPGLRLYNTGDLSRWLGDGAIDFLGRRDLQVKLRGFRIELGEIESTLGSHEAVSRAVVAMKRGPSGDPCLAAYAVAAGKTVSPEALRFYLREKLPEYMVPATVVLLPSLPLTPSGKIDLEKLPEPEGIGTVEARSYVAASTPTEEAVVLVWRELLKLPRIGAQDNFFDLGGHSLMAIRVVSRLRLSLGLDFPIKALFEHPVVAEFAQYLDLSLWSAGLSESRNGALSEEFEEEGEL